MSLRFLSAMVLVATLFMGVSPALASHNTDPNIPCTCSASVSLAKPQLRFSGGVLTFIPAVDISIRSRGNMAQPRWTATLAYSGETSYESDDVTPPGGTSFSTTKEMVSGYCGSRYTFKGHQLPAVALSGLTSQFVGADQELDGLVKMKAEVTGCGEDSAEKGFKFTLEEFGNLFVRGWRTIR